MSNRRVVVNSIDKKRTVNALLAFNSDITSDRQMSDYKLVQTQEI